MNDAFWSEPRGWNALRASGEETIEPDEAQREGIARKLDLEALRYLKARLAYEPWLDGVRVRGNVEATAVRLCGVSLEPLEEPIDTSLDLRLLPAGSPNAPPPESEIVLTLDEDDPPDAVSGNNVDLASLAVEALALALDPFPRKEGVTFSYTDPDPEPSPFAILKTLGGAGRA